MVMPINKEKLELRDKVAKGRPDFKRPESWRYKRLETTWRKPKGIDNINVNKKVEADLVLLKWDTVVLKLHEDYIHLVIQII